MPKKKNHLVPSLCLDFTDILEEYARSLQEEHPQVSIYKVGERLTEAFYSFADHWVYHGFEEAMQSCMEKVETDLLHEETDMPRH